MSDKEAKPQESIAEALMRELRFGGIDKENLKELVGIVAGIQKGGLKRFKVFPKGIPFRWSPGHRDNPCWRSKQVSQ